MRYSRRFGKIVYIIILKLTYVISKYNSFRMIFLYYGRLSANSPQGYLPATDVHSICDAVIYNGFALAN